MTVPASLTLFQWFGAVVLLTLGEDAESFSSLASRQQKAQSYASTPLVTAYFLSAAGNSGSATHWHDATIVSHQNACPSGKSILIRVRVDSELHETYKTPGQFVKFKWNDNDFIFLAMSSAPSSSTTTTPTAAATAATTVRTLEFLIKMSPNLPWLRNLAVGTTVQISDVMGDGFALDDLVETMDPESTIILVAAGSGIAPLKACMESGILPRSSSSAVSYRIYYGEWTDNDLCFTNAECWKDCQIIPVLSRAHRDPVVVTTTTIGNDSARLKQQPQHRWHVQQALRADAIPQNAGAILCGMDSMMEDVTSILVDAGINKNRILVNL